MPSQIIQLQRTLMNTVSHKKHLIFQFLQLPYLTGMFRACCWVFAADGMLWQKSEVKAFWPVAKYVFISVRGGGPDIWLRSSACSGFNLCCLSFSLLVVLRVSLSFISCKEVGGGVGWGGGISADNEIVVLCICVGTAANRADCLPFCFPDLIIPRVI